MALGVVAAFLAIRPCAGEPTAGSGLPTGGELDLSLPVPDAPPNESCMFCRRYARRLVNDTRHVLSAPWRWDHADWRHFALDTGLVIGSMALLDRRVADHFDEHHNDTKNDLPSTFEPFGAEYAAGVLGGFYLAGRLGDNPNAYAVAQDGFAASLITSALIVPALKLTFGRDRPSADTGAHRFAPFGGGSSFPSGHTAEAFTLAATIAEHYDAAWVDWTAYGAATLVGYARMEHRAHFLSDVMAGALIGVSVAKAVVGRHTATGHRVHIGPAVLQDGLLGVELTATY